MTRNIAAAAILLASIALCHGSVSQPTSSTMASPSLRTATQPLARVGEKSAVQALRGGVDAPLERSLAIIKPDAVAAGNADNIKKAIKDNGFKIVAEKKMHLSKAKAQNFYAEHKGKPFYEGLVEFMTSGPVIVMTLQKNGAIKGWRELMGPTNSIKARAEAKNSMRALYGTDGGRNACHGSDSPKSAAREIRFFFGIFAWLKLVLPFYKTLFWPK
eukprot:CAMPEP_0206239894 /NCGR_PEP_ID=MMETSP0047_2-20121206/15639_1 /ASSEMBLY_ACC=CAM_ASM_000192 /TAXON_ID=195065 /ORGANISM="Chroomonas mesostigmatica_cf, Strain CCMP1168" /LENGTH=215 /DNA_ID=CAMNT_0053664621 /DNA_START=34 /DNA_END=681 /DNA_ORIENTATION=-